MKYIAKHLEESKYPLELRGPFSYRDDIPGLSKHLFVAFKMVNLLQAAGLDQSKMYMKAMFPAGMADTKKELMEKVCWIIFIMDMVSICHNADPDLAMKVKTDWDPDPDVEVQIEASACFSMVSDLNPFHADPDPGL